MWITLLYVGVVPLRYTYFTTCSKCRKLTIVDKDKVDELREASHSDIGSHLPQSLRSEGEPDE